MQFLQRVGARHRPVAAEGHPGAQPEQRPDPVLPVGPLRSDERQREVVVLLVLARPQRLEVPGHPELGEPFQVGRVDELQVGDVVPNDNGSVICVFKGQILNMDILKQPFSDYTGPYSGLMAFYQSSYMNLVNRKEEAYLEGFSPASRKQEEAMIADANFENFAYRNTLPTRKVGFILNADPVYYIFWHSEDGDSFTYDTVLKTTDMKFQRVNIQHDTTLDHLLTDRTFMDNLQNLIEDSN